jgi:branched-subunit amino acid transport protein
MNRRSQPRAGALASSGQASKTRRVGARAFDRQRARSLAKAKRRRAARRRSGPPPPNPFSLALAQLRRIPRAAWLCAIVACVNAACWSILVPPFQVTDEPSHFAYTQVFAETNKLPSSAKGSFSPEESVVLRDLNQYNIRESPETRAISTAAQQHKLQSDLGRKLSRHGEGVGGAYSDPPLFYFVETVPYGLTSWGTLLDQLEGMRLLSALLAGLTGLFTYLFLREALPARRWAWTVGGLCVAVAPLLGFISGGVNPDSMLIAVSAAAFYFLARAFRRGLDRRLTIAIGATIAVGFLTKLNFVGLVPGILLGLVVLSVRSARINGRDAYRWLGIALAIAFAPVGLYAIVNLLSGRAEFGIVSSTLKLKGAHSSIFTQLSYVWQLYLPRLPGMTSFFPGLSTTRGLWFDRGLGYYGWLDTTFPLWVDNLAIVPVGVLTALCARSLLVGREMLRRRIAELATYATMALGLLLLIGLSSYVDLAEGIFADPRYLLPLLPLLGAGLALAARGAGRRWGPPAGALIVVLFLAHNIFSQILVVGRYYS